MTTSTGTRLPPNAAADARSRSYPPSPPHDLPPVGGPPAPDEDLAEATPSPQTECAEDEAKQPARPRLRRPSQINAHSSDGRSLYERIGRTVGVRRLARRFFDLMETLPEAAPCRAVFPPDLDDSRQKFFEYLNGWLGGPQLYLKRRGAPKLRRRHFLINIGPAQRDAWLLCFRRAAEETIADRAVIAALMPQVESIAYYLQNRE